MLSKLEGPRPAQPEELPQIIALANHVMRGGREPTIATDYSFIYNLENVRNVIVVKDDDIVDFSGSYDDYLRSQSIYD